MANSYTSIYLADAIALINETALRIMKKPGVMLMSGSDAQMGESVQTMNDRIAHYNEGVRNAAMVIADALEKSVEDDAE